MDQENVKEKNLPIEKKSDKKSRKSLFLTLSLSLFLSRAFNDYLSHTNFQQESFTHTRLSLTCRRRPLSIACLLASTLCVCVSVSFSRLPLVVRALSPLSWRVFSLFLLLRPLNCLLVPFCLPLFVNEKNKLHYFFTCTCCC